MNRINSLVVIVLLLVACGSAGPRPPHVGRDAGRIDGARSTSTNSEAEWRIRKEPAIARDEAAVPGVAPEPAPTAP